MHGQNHIFFIYFMTRCQLQMLHFALFSSMTKGAGTDSLLLKLLLYTRNGSIRWTIWLRLKVVCHWEGVKWISGKFVVVKLRARNNTYFYIFFWVFPRRQIVVGRRFGTLYQFHLELIQGSETSANYNFTPGKYPEENIQYSNHGESLKSRTLTCLISCLLPRAEPFLRS